MNTDKLKRLAFSDDAWPRSAQRVHILYAYVLGRAPDPSGMQHYVEKCKTMPGFLLSWWSIGISRESIKKPFIGFRMIMALLFSFLQWRVPPFEPLLQGNCRFNLDQPKIGTINIFTNPCFVSGWAVNLEMRDAAKVRAVFGGKIYHSRPIQRPDVQRIFSPAYDLPVETGFSIDIELPVGFNKVRIEMEDANGSWGLVHLARLFRRPQMPFAREAGKLTYGSWVRLQSVRLKAELPEITRHIEVMLRKPFFTVVVDTRSQTTGLEDTILSIRRQLYPYFNIHVITGPEANAAFSLSDDVKPLICTSLPDIRGDFFVLLHSGQRLACNAFYEFASAINKYPDIDLVYGDEDFPCRKDSRGDPFHKPGWSPDYLETFNYIGFTACFRGSIAQSCFGHSMHSYDFTLRFTERTNKVLHVPKVLGHHADEREESEATLSEAAALDIAALSGRLNRTGRRGSVREHGQHKGCYEIRLDLRSIPLVSIVIPTAGKTIKVMGRQIDLLRNVVSQIRDMSTYKNIEIIVVDNDDLTNKQIRFLKTAGCKRISYREPVFNVAKKLNLGAAHARGEMLLLLNDDIEILSPSWIERMLEQLEKPHVGVVGARLLYPDGQTQHVGVVLNFGNPDHVRRHFLGGEAGYFFSTCGVRNYSAVTGACMMTSTAIYREVGGYSEELAVSFNDIDYCFKVREKGLLSVYAPGAELTHMESKSRVATMNVKEYRWFQHRWVHRIYSDEFYNERFLTVAPPTFETCVNERML